MRRVVEIVDYELGIHIVDKPQRGNLVMGLLRPTDRPYNIAQNVSSTA